MCLKKTNSRLNKSVFHLNIWRCSKRLMEILKYCVLLLVLVVIPKLDLLQNVLATQLYVVPWKHPEQCPTTNKSRCLTLNNYTEQAASYFLSNTTFAFLPGNHLLRLSATFDNLSDISLVSYAVSLSQQLKPVITCFNAEFSFRNIVRLKIENLTFSGCGQLYRAAIDIHEVTNLSITHVDVRDSLEYGVRVLNVFGVSPISYSNFTHNTQGGNALIQYKNYSHRDTVYTSLLTITSSFFGHGLGYMASGILAFIWCTNVNLEIDSVTLFNNTGKHGVGGNMAIILRNRTNLITNHVLVTNCHIEAGNSFYGGGLFLSFEQVPPTLADNNYTQLMRIEDTNFTRNHATGEGGGLYIIMHEVVGLLHPVGLITVTNCLFDSNTLDSELTAGVALHINCHFIPGHEEHITPQYQVQVNHTTFANSSSVVLDADTYSKNSAMFVLQKQSGVYVSDSIFESNAVTGLIVGRSNVIFSGDIMFQGNVGFDGGAIALCDRSFVFLTPNCNVSLINNRAINTGGGMYIGSQCLQSIPECFYQFSRLVLEDMSLLNTITMYLANNSAEIAGSAIYGGSVNFCVVMDPWMYTPKTIFGSDIYDKVFYIPHNVDDYSYVTSDPYKICFCSEMPHVQPNCTITTLEKSIYPGSNLTVTVVAVGQRDGTVPGSVKAVPKHPTSLGRLQGVQEVQVNCTALNYTVYTPVNSTEIKLHVEHPLLSAPPTLKIKNSFIQISLKSCPIGFTLSSDGICTCGGVLAGKSELECLLDPFPAVRRSSNAYSWIGYHNSSHATESGVLYHQFCPFDYCIVDNVYIRVSETSFDQDAQCSYSRRGVLCGRCPPGQSTVFGSSKCRVCSNRFLWLIVAFAVTGIALVVFLNISRLTVTNGALNGLIFYANVMQINWSFIVKDKTNFNFIFRVFIAWLNFDLGIETCFYNGMDSFVKVLLQFAFPVYVLFLAFLIIFLCRRYDRFAALMGNNSVKVLATLFFLCYAKLLRIIISIFTASIIVYPDSTSKTKWTEDGNIPFAQGKHLTLIIVGILAISFSLPFTIIVTLYPCIQRSNLACFHWIHRLKPLLDAYGGPYKDKYRSWTGLLLFARIFLFLKFAVNTQQNAHTNLVAILQVCLIILVLGWVFGGVYKQRSLDCLEASFLLNLAVLSILSLKAMLENDLSEQNRLTLVSISVALATCSIYFLWKLVNKVLYQKCQSCLMHAHDNDAVTIPPLMFSLNASILDIHQRSGRKKQGDEEQQPLLS